RRYGGTAVRRYEFDRKWCGTRGKVLLTWRMVPYDRFTAWKVAHELALTVYAESETWPLRERYGITAQIRRAALSAPTNIAEGSAKRGKRELRRYLDIALGSLSEVSYLLRFSRDRGILGREKFAEIDELRNRAGQLTWKLYESLREFHST
ncbi:MAG TPA: four helix bundle protein, partial [Gemmatimonadales bacterium]